MSKRLANGTSAGRSSSRASAPGRPLAAAVGACLGLALACGGTDEGDTFSSALESGGSGGAVAATGGAVETGGVAASGGAAPVTGGALATGGAPAATGGSASTGGAPPGGGGPVLSGDFVHPGTLDGAEELAFVRAQLELGASPWKEQFDHMVSVENLAAAPAPLTSIDAKSGQADAARNDARRAYGNALAWYLTGDEAYALQAVAYLDAWSALESITSTDDQNKLVAGWLGSLLGPAADLMLSYDGWAASDVEATRAMFRRAFYPLLDTASTWNGNVDLHQISALLAIAVFVEDPDAFDAGLARLAARVPAYFYLEADGLPASIAGDGGNVTTFWSSPTLWVDGLTQETCRDNGHHAQFGMSGALGAMETAWHQGVDVYSPNQDRMVAALELLGLQLSSGSMQGTCASDVATAGVYDTGWGSCSEHMFSVPWYDAA